MFVIKESGKLIRDKQIRDNGGHRVGPFLWVKPVPAMPAGVARGLLLAATSRRLVRSSGAVVCSGHSVPVDRPVPCGGKHWET